MGFGGQSAVSAAGSPWRAVNRVVVCSSLNFTKAILTAEWRVDWRGQDQTQRQVILCNRINSNSYSRVPSASLNDSQGHDANVHVSEIQGVRGLSVKNMFNKGILFSFISRSL